MNDTQSNSMPLTKIQRNTLVVYQQFRERPMTVSGLFWASRKAYLILFALFGAVAALYYSAGWNVGASCVGMAFVSIVVRDIGHFRRSAAVWPVVREVLDWDRVASKLGNQDSQKSLRNESGQ
jgi:hypothetical protein